MRAGIDSTNKSYDESIKRTEKLKKAYEDLKDSGKATKKELSEAKKAYQESANETKAYEQELKTLNTELNNHEAELANLPGKLAQAKLATAELRNEAERLHAEYRNNGGRLADTAKRWQEMGDKISGAGQRMTAVGDGITKLTAPLALGMGFAVKQAIDFEDAFTGVVKTVDAPKAKLDELRQSFIDMSKEIPVSANELSRIGETAGQLGIQVPYIESFTKTVAMLGATTNLSSEQAATELSKFMNVMGTAQTDIDRLGSTIVALGNNFATTESDISSMSQRISGAGKLVNASEADILALAASLSSVGIEAEAGGTAISKVLKKMNNVVMSTRDYDKALAEAAATMNKTDFTQFKAELDSARNSMDTLAEVSGVSTEKFAKLFKEKPIEALNLFVKGLDNAKKNGKNLTEVLDEIGVTGERESDALLRLGGNSKLLGDALSLSNKAWSENNALTKEANTRFETTSSKLTIAKNKIIAQAIAIGSKLLPKIVNLIEKSQPLITAIGNLIDAFANMGTGMQLFILGAGPVLSMLGRLTTGFGNTVKSVGDFIQWFGKITTPKGLAQTADALDDVVTSAGNAGGAATLFSNPWVLAGGAVVAAIGGIGYYIYQEATKYDRSHQESVTATQGKYQEWFDAVVAGSASSAEAQKQIQDATTQTGETYAKVAERIKKQNHEVLTDTEDSWSGGMRWIEIGGEQIRRHVKSVEVPIRQLGVLTEEEITSMGEAYKSHGILLGNTLTEIGNAFTSHQKVTAQWAIAQVDQVSNVTETVKTKFEEEKQAALQSLEQRKEFYGAGYDAEVQRVTQAYDQKIAKVSQAEATITGILQSASANNRELSAQEVVSILRSYQDLAEGAGELLSSISDAQKIMGSNLKALTSDVGLEFLTQAGLIDEATAKEIAALGNTEEAVNKLSKALESYNQIEISPKDAEVSVMGEEELQRIVELFGGDWASLTDEQKTALANAEGLEELEDLLYEWGIWKSESPTEAKVAVLQGEVTPEFHSAIEAHGLWNNSEFVSKFADIETNAPDAEEQIRALLSEWGVVLPEDVKILTTQTNAGENTGVVQEYATATEGVADKSVSFTANLFDLVTQTLSVLGFKAATDGLEDKSANVTTSVGTAGEDATKLAGFTAEASKMTDTNATATTSVPNGPMHTYEVANWNTTTNQMKDKKSTATTSTPNTPTRTVELQGWNNTMGHMSDESSTATTSTPNISSNTSLGWSWINMMDSTYNKTSYLTTYYDRVYRTFGSPGQQGQHATGGHIGMFANGGNISKWGGMFANGGNVPVGYTGIVGEAGPEIFQVTKKGVSITPLSTYEKMRGIKGVLDEHAKGSGDNSNGSVVVNFDLSNLVVRDERDIDVIADKVAERIARVMKRDKITRKGSVVGHVGV